MDLAVIGIPIQGVPEIIRECGQVGINAAIIISAGGKEAGEEGLEIEAAINEEAQKAGVRYLGPNCLGLSSARRASLHASFAPLFAPTRQPGLHLPERRPVQLHPGVGHPKNIGFCHFISVGSMADVDFGDLIDYLGNEDERQEHRHLHGKPDPAPHVS